MLALPSPAVALDRLLLTSIGGILALKIAVLATRHRPLPSSRLALFLFAWPGVFPDAFRRRRPPQPIEASRFFSAWARTAAGIVSIVLLAVYAPRLPEDFLGLAGTAALLLTIHLGLCDLLPWLLCWAGFEVPLLFDRPWAARSLAEFWGRRWNLAFIEMDRRLLLRPLHRIAGGRGARFALFILSGLLHEAGLSFPADGGWGLPLVYFLLQGVLVEIEDRFRIAHRAWTWFWLLAPAPWLFHAPFRRALILPLYSGLHALLAGHTLAWYVSGALYAAAIGHLAVLVASFQAPARLRWKHDLAKLTRFNRRIFWLYGFYIGFSILGFSALTLCLHDAFLAGNGAARGLALFIAVFWTIRVLADFVWYDRRDWPPGNALVAGHALLTTLFCSLAAVYWFAVFLPA